MIDKENNKNIKIDCENNDLIKNNLIEFLEIQLKESRATILEKELTSEKETMSILNRLNKEVENSRKFSLENLIKSFLPLFDNIERTLNLIENKKSDKNFTDITDQLKLTCNLLKEFLELFYIKKIDETNIPFNPLIHEAMSVHYTNEIESNKIVTVMQPGYILHESRLLRPAMVIVSKKKM